MAKYQKGAGLGGYTCTTGPKRGGGDHSGNNLGPYAENTNLNRQKAHRNNGTRGKAYNKTS